VRDPARPPRFPTAAREAILRHFDEHGRPLAFRRTRDPWAILVSETMAQQTQAARVAERWERFMRRFPTVPALADATPADVLREWQGLGYDRRGLALWKAARVIVTEHDGRVPASIEALQALPGVGPYTARAVAAIAFGMPVGAVDVNVRRVLGRVVAGSRHALDAKAMQTLADAAVPPDRAGDWTHAVMDVGATLCRPRTPRCGACPAATACRYAGESGAGEATAAPRLRATGDGAPFTATNRWLRGRILDRLREVPDAAWTTVAGPIGSHDDRAVRSALRALAHDGVIELDVAVDRHRARLPLG
jgi:A/G-specific adenine glycosylase